MPTGPFIDKTIRKWKIKLRIRRAVFWTTDFKIWKQLGSAKARFTGSQVYGATQMPQNLIFINLKKNRTKKETERTIVHELLHAKFPSLPERKLQKRVEKLLNPTSKIKRAR